VQSVRRRRSAAIVAALLIVGFAVLSGFAIMQSYLAQRSSEAEALAAAPLTGSTPSQQIPEGSSLPFILMVLFFGASIGAAAAWVWIARSRRRSDRALPEQLSRQMPVASNGDPQVFISYSRQDGPTVGQLVQQIEQLGFAVWIDRQSTGSERYAAPIVHAIRMSRLVALMCSQNAFLSDHVIREVYVAGDFKKPFIAFQLDATEFPDKVLYFVSGFRGLLSPP